MQDGSVPPGRRMADMSISKQLQHVVAQQSVDSSVRASTPKRRHENSNLAVMNSAAIAEELHSSPDGLRLTPDSLRRKQAFMQRSQAGGARSPLLQEARAPSPVMNSAAIADELHSSSDGLRLSPDLLRRKQAFMQRSQAGGARSPLSSNTKETSLRETRAMSPVMNSAIMAEALHSNPDGMRLSPDLLRRRQAFMQRSQAGPRSPLSSNLNGTAMSPAALRSTGLFSEAAPMSVVDI